MGDLSDDTWLYRAITKRAWFDKETQRIQPAAFQLRQRDNTESGYEAGISTNLDPDLCYFYFNKKIGQYEQLSPCFGVLKISVGTIRSLGLEVDNNHHSHVNIIGFPHPDREKAKYLELRDKLSKMSVIHQLFDPPKEKPKKKK